MTRKTSICKYCFLLYVIIGCYTASAQSSDTAGGYRLVWADEFNKDGAPDASHWGFEEGFVRNHELQWYQRDNAFCNNGMLVIEARKEKRPNPGYVAGSNQWPKSVKEINYTSSSINTSSKHSWLYGRFVMRGRINTDNGLWPAWWTLGVNGEWPSNGEIDIMEFYRGKLLANIACADSGRYKALWFSNTKSLQALGGPAWSKEFHTWRMDWDEQAIALYVDDTLMIRVELNKLVNRNNDGIKPFQQPHYMLFDFALGGDNGGDPSGTVFPNRFEVDYVRVYQKR